MNYFQKFHQNKIWNEETPSPLVMLSPAPPAACAARRHFHADPSRSSRLLPLAAAAVAATAAGCSRRWLQPGLQQRTPAGRLPLPEFGQIQERERGLKRMEFCKVKFWFQFGIWVWEFWRMREGKKALGCRIGSGDRERKS